MRVNRSFVLIVVLGLGACGPGFAPPTAVGTPCTQISASEFESAVQAGATKAEARIRENGIVSMDVGPGSVRCASYSNAVKPCRRPNDFVIRYELADGNIIHVKVPAGEQYRLRVQARPTTCEIVK